MYKYKKIRLSDGATRDEHVLVMEEYLGRPLEPDECVHHCDEQKKHNPIENLELMLRTEHTRMHFYNRVTVPCSNCGAKLVKHPYRIKESKTGTFFCNIICKTEYQKKTRNYGR